MVFYTWSLFGYIPQMKGEVQGKFELPGSVTQYMIMLAPTHELQ